MDGWKRAGKRHTGYDWAIIQLGVAGHIKALDIDTTFFTGNYLLQLQLKPATPLMAILLKLNG